MEKLQNENVDLNETNSKSKEFIEELEMALIESRAISVKLEADKLESNKKYNDLLIEMNQKTKDEKSN